jgi:hypothetical protein
MDSGLETKLCFIAMRGSGGEAMMPYRRGIDQRLHERSRFVREAG